MNIEVCQWCGHGSRDDRGKVIDYVPGKYHDGCLLAFIRCESRRAKAGLIHPSKLQIVMMGAGDKPDKIIDFGVVKTYVGIGWVGDGLATKDDYKKYPVVDRRDLIEREVSA